MERIEQGYYTKTNSLPKDEEEDKDKDDLKQFFYHLPYHPRGLKQNQIQQAYKQHIYPHVGKPLTIAIHRPKNIRDYISPSRLPHIKGENPSNINPPRHMRD